MGSDKLASIVPLGWLCGVNRIWPPNRRSWGQYGKMARHQRRTVQAYFHAGRWRFPRRSDSETGNLRWDVSFQLGCQIADSLLRGRQAQSNSDVEREWLESLRRWTRN